ncbi:Transmembrane domain-containing protein [Brazilian cedratvirus IHUMI]|uniref:Transmembrane domain-containing protein n=1 Tax=Brazilian cedratvirus IHUMI TaxID=2126980 RepID=A0A2R8FEE1_9VIRU|nr:Transmembrane domain-containing protein [Brazilian cedratvirus IHUMI]
MSTTINTLKQPLSSLAQESPEVSTYEVTTKKNVFSGGSFVSYIVWFIIIAIIVWVILIATKPTWVQKYNELGQPTGEVDQARAITWAVIIAIILVIIIWIIRAATGPKATVTKTTDYVF